MRKLAAPLNWMLVLIVAGCASYEPTSTSLPQISANSKQTFENGFTAAAEPCIDPNLQLALFDADFTEAGIIAIQVAVGNETDHSVVAQRADMNLALPNGQRLRPISAETVARQVGEGGSPTAMLLGFGILGSMAADNAEEMARTARATDYRLKQFDGSAIAPGSSAQGYVYFSPSMAVSGTGSAHLEVRVRDPNESTSTTLIVPINNAALQVKSTPKAVPTHTIR